MNPEAVLGAEGPVARALGAGFEARPEQLAMVRAVAEAMEARSHLLVEAGTGVGKSFAYLVPAMARCMARGERVLIATNTIALQEQLIEKDIPLLTGLMGGAEAGTEDAEGEGPVPPGGVRAVLVKGRGNYVSVRRLRLASERQDRIFADAAARRSLHVIEDWAYQTRDGTLSTLPPLERPGVWDKVQSDSGNCMGRRCPTFAQCFFQQARAGLEGANLLVCNHALFFSDLALRAQEVGFLPAYDHVILDEAHGIEDVASEHFGVTLAEGRVQHLLSTLHHPRTGKGYLAQLALLVGDSQAVARAIGLVDDASRATRAMFDGVAGLMRGGGPWTGGGPGGGGGGERSIRLRGEGLVANVVTPAFRELSLRLMALKDQVKGEPDRYELNSYAQRAGLIADDAATLVSQALEGYAYWAEAGAEDGPGGRRLTLACAPIEVGPILKERLFRQSHSVILTSATLTTRTSAPSEARERAETAFSHVMGRLGCEGARTVQLGSPFDYARQVEVFVGLPRGARDSARMSGLSQAILHHVRATGGGAFVLFTSFAMLSKCASELAGVLAAEGYPMLAQGRDGPRGEILARFRENDRSVLLGAASFWQGVDVRGRGLRNVIITKLPFEPPDRPLTQARHELIESRGGNAFAEDSLPRAIIRFKQGFGRLVRSRSDSGRVVVLDERVITARYGRMFLAALPEGVAVVRDEEDGDGWSQDGV